MTREPGFAARIIGEALAATNRVSLSHARRLDLTEQYWKSAALLWPRLERQFTRASHPLQGDNLEAAKASLTLANELSIAYKRLLAREASRRLLWGGPRRMVALVRRAFQATSRVLANSYLSYAPVPPHTWYDAHDIYMYTRERKIHRHPVTLDQPDVTLERLYVQSLLLALANPYGFLPSQLAIVLNYLQEQRAAREAHAGAAGAPDGQGRRDRAGGPRLPAVLGEQGRLGRRLEAVPADVRPRVPAAGADPRARIGRAAAARSRQRTPRRAAATSRC